MITYFSGDDKVATKVICYTRSSSSIHQLPVSFPKAAFSSAEELQQSTKYVKDLIYDKVFWLQIKTYHVNVIIHLL